MPTGLVVFHSASSLNQLSVDIHVDPLEHIIMILGQPVCALFLLGDACLAETLQIPIASSFTVFRLLTDFVCLYTYEFCLSL